MENFKNPCKTAIRIAIIDSFAYLGYRWHYLMMMELKFYMNISNQMEKKLKLKIKNIFYVLNVVIFIQKNICHAI